jgi:hypothetical protein
MLCQLSYASNWTGRRVAGAAGVNFAAAEIATVLDEYTTGPGRDPTARDDGNWHGAGLEGEGQSTAEAALILGEDEQGAVGGEVGLVALREQILYI